MRIREAGPADIPAIARVTVDTWRTTYRGILPDDLLANLSYPQREQVWTRALANNGRRHAGPGGLRLGGCYGPLVPARRTGLI